jgi:peptide/nickel transport system substrate-binding protein
MYLGVLVIAIIVVAGVGVGLYLTRPVGPPNPNTIIVDTIADAQYMDPATDYETAGGEIIQNVYEGLLFYNGSSAADLVPVLASSMPTISDLGTTYTFTLRHGITFHDGTPFNASVMKWCLDRVVLINDPRGPAWMMEQCIRGATTYASSPAWKLGNRTGIYEAARAYFAANGVEIVDNYTIRIHVDYLDSLAGATNTTAFGTPYAGFVYILAFTVGDAISYSFVDAHGGNTADIASDLNSMSVARYNRLNHGGPAATSVPYDQGRGVTPGVHNAYVDFNTCGTGPYMLTEWTKNVRMVMTANPYYWGGPKGTGVAPTQSVIINVIPDFNSRKLAFLAGDCDIVAWGAVYADQLINVATRTVLPQYAADVRVDLDRGTFDIEQLQFNENQTLPTGGANPSVLCTKINGSSAVDAATNPMFYRDFRRALVAAFNYTAYNAFMNGFVRQLNGYIPYGMVCYDASIPNPTQNMTLAAQLLTKVGWEGTIYIYYNTGSSARQTVCTLFKDMVEKAATAAGLSITVTINQLTWSTYLGLMNGGTLSIGDIGWAPDYADPDDYAMPYASSIGTFSAVIWFTNSTIDSEIAQAATTLSVPARTLLYSDISWTLYKQAVYLWLGQASTFHVERTWIHGYLYNPMFSGLIYYYMSKY